MTAPDLPNETPYAGLDPEVVLDALDAVGLRGDGRLIQLNSYENRVFQVFLEEGAPVVAKFYRPGRWTNEQILEEHQFAGELLASEVPVAAPLVLTLDARSLRADRAALIGPTLASFQTTHGQHRFAVAQRMAGRGPELEDLSVLEWIGRYIGRIHAVGARGRFAHRQTMDVATFGTDSARRACSPTPPSRPTAFPPGPRCPNWPGRWRKPRSTASRRPDRSACMATVIRATSSGPHTARTSSISTMPSPARPCRTCGCCSRENVLTTLRSSRRSARRL